MNRSSFFLSRSWFLQHLGAGPRRFGALTAMGVFLFFGAVMACYAGVTLIWRGSFLDQRLSAIHPAAFQQLTVYGKMIGIPFLALGAALALAGVGWIKRQRGDGRSPQSLRVAGQGSSASTGERIHGTPLWKEPLGSRSPGRCSSISCALPPAPLPAIGCACLPVGERRRARGERKECER